ncbi:MAG: hypothetical protein ACYC6B_09940 [Thermoleophilia bacterium]
MPRKLELESLEVEIAAVAALLSEAREINDPVGTLQFEQRKKELEEKIIALRGAEIHQASLALFFGGEPVFGSRGIAADFAGRLLDSFQDIISKQFAVAEMGSLGERGPVPLREFTTLMITGVTHGSFGFVLDELTDQDEMFDSALKEIVREVLTTIEFVSSFDEVVFEEAIERLDARTLASLKTFFNELDSNTATIRMVDDDRDLSLDENAIHRARLRIEDTTIEENEVEIKGLLIGFLPEHKRFELRIESGELIFGTASKLSTEQFNAAPQSGGAVIGKRCVIRAEQRTIIPVNRPMREVYKLIEFISFLEED